MRPFSILFLLSLLTLPAAQPPPAQERLDAVVQRIVTRGARGAPAPDPAPLLAELRRIDPGGLSPASRIDRRFAETILVGRQIAADRRDGPSMPPSRSSRRSRRRSIRRRRGCRSPTRSSRTIRIR
jgi:hypothetical protein